MEGMLMIINHNEIPKDLKKLHEDKIAELRELEDLPPKIYKKNVQGITVASNTEQAQITGIREDRGFVYLNLNGGDSWGYYHPSTNPEILYNFKGEPNYAIKTFLPEYYASAKQRADESQQEQNIQEQEEAGGLIYLGFREKYDSLYYCGTYDLSSRKLDIHPTRNRTAVIDYLKEHGQIVADYIPTWEYQFEFDNSTCFDSHSKFINRYQESDALANPQPSMYIPRNIRKVLLHIMNKDKECVDSFVNWLAFIIQKRQPPRTAWLFHGTEGTGKGILFERILTPLFGRDYTQQLDIDDMDTRFNDFVDGNVLLFLNEMEVNNSSNPVRLMNKLKPLVTDTHIQTEAKYQVRRAVRNQTNLIIASNKPEPIHLTEADRRFHVAPRQETHIKDVYGETEVPVIADMCEAEVPAFVGYLKQLAVDEDAARYPQMNEAKRVLVYISQSAIDQVCIPLMRGDLEYFASHMPNDSILTLTAREIAQADIYKAFVKQAAIHARSKDPAFVSRDVLKDVFAILLERPPKASNHFEALLKHYGLHMQKRRVNGIPEFGVHIHWHADDELVKALLDEKQFRAVK